MLTRTLFLLIPLFIFGQTAEEVAKAMDARSTPKDMRSDLSMILTNKQGKTRESSIRSIAADDNSKQIIWFLSPPDDKGVAFLKVEQDNGDDEMRLWLPAFKKVRRISSSKKADSFMGSDLSYEDMTNREFDEYTYALAGEEVVEGHPCHVLVSTPREGVTRTYSKFVSYVAKDDYRTLREEAFDRSGNLLKTREVKFQQVGEYTLPVEMFVTNVQSNHSTKLVFSNIEVDQGVEDDLFQEKNLKRMPR